MPTDSMSAQTGIEAAAHETLVASLRNTHALEKQQIQVLGSHLDLFDEYPDLHARVKDHIVATREQARRLEAALEACGDSASMFKDALMTVMGLGQSSVQGFGDDAVLKAVTADIVQEHLEIATYRTLVTLADMAGAPEVRPRLEETLREEEAMAEWFDQNLEAIVRRVVEIKAGREADARLKEDSAAQEKSPTSDEEMSGTLWQQLENADRSSTESKSKSEQHPGVTPATPSANPCPKTPRPSQAKALAGGDASRPTNPADRP
jgi:ferritin-like metal-binding protein YciE